MKKLLFLIPILLMGFASCEKFEGDQTVPAYLTIDSITVKKNPAFSKYTDTVGFLTHEIPYVKIIVDKNHKVGIFQLPVNIPILKEGYQQIDIYAVVKQSGISDYRIEYPFYKVRTLENVKLTPGETTNLGTIATQYESENQIMKYDDFEDDVVLSFDTNMVFYRAKDSVKYGKRCGAIKLRADLPYTETTYNQAFTSSNRILYLELDYACNIPFDVYFRGYVSEEAQDIPVMALKPTNGVWRKIYILLGRSWAQLSYPEKFNVIFVARNENKSEGLYVHLDNIKLVSK